MIRNKWCQVNGENRKEELSHEISNFLQYMTKKNGLVMTEKNQTQQTYGISELD